MAEKIREVNPPRGLFRWLVRLPVWLYRARLGGMLGDRFLMLTYIGRKSGQPRQVVLEVVRHDKDTDTYYVAVGFGERTDWYRNVLKTPEVVVQSGWRQLAARAERLPPASICAFYSLRLATRKTSSIVVIPSRTLRMPSS